MNECVTIVRARKAQSISVPAGGYFLLVGPEKPWAAHAAKRQELLAGGQVSEDYDLLISGNVANRHSNVAFRTAAEVKADRKEAADLDASLSNGNKEAEQRAAKLKAEADKKAKEAHLAKVAEINKVNDGIRLRK